MAECVLFVEGSRNTDNGELRSGFNKLLQQANLRRMPQIVMCNDTAGAIRKFRQETDNPRPRFQRVLVLVDLDGPDATRTAWLADKALTAHRDRIFFMVQRMEAWFLAQPAVVHEFYLPGLSHALPAAAGLVQHPDRELIRCTRDHPKKGTYHKTAHGAKLLALLRFPDLQRAFPDVARLILVL